MIDPLAIFRKLPHGFGFGAAHAAIPRLKLGPILAANRNGVRGTVFGLAMHPQLESIHKKFLKHQTKLIFAGSCRRSRHDIVAFRIKPTRPTLHRRFVDNGKQPESTSSR